MPVWATSADCCAMAGGACLWLETAGTVTSASPGRVTASGGDKTPVQCQGVVTHPYAFASVSVSGRSYHHMTGWSREC